MLQKKAQAQHFTIPGGTEGILHNQITDKDVSVALVDFDGLYPEKGWSVNSKCTETFLLVSGTMSVEIQDGETAESMQPGDMFSVLPGQKYKSDGKGTLVDIITPKWEKSQNKIITE